MLTNAMSETMFCLDWLRTRGRGANLCISCKKASYSRLTRNIPHGIQRAIHNLSLSALTPFSTSLRLSLELSSLPVSHGRVSLVFFHAVKVYAVMQALRDQVVGDNCLLQDNQSIS